MIQGKLNTAIIFAFLLIILMACSTPRWLKQVYVPTGADTSIVYQLPYTTNKAYIVAQGYWGNFSHKKTYALDFKMRRGQPVCAARSGVVLATASHFAEKKGRKKNFIEQANYIDILHSDGTVASYWHLQQNGVLVKPGDTVNTGQHIAYSGNTGFSTMPHLHFEVYKRDNRGYHSIPTRFLTKKGATYLRWGKMYRNQY